MSLPCAALTSSSTLCTLYLMPVLELWLEEIGSQIRKVLQSCPSISFGRKDITHTQLIYNSWRPASWLAKNTRFFFNAKRAVIREGLSDGAEVAVTLDTSVIVYALCDGGVEHQVSVERQGRC
jgi:hypothetical protein